MALDPPAPARRFAAVRLAAVAETTGVVALLLWSLLSLAHATGGREPHSLSVGLMLLVVAIVASRMWRHLPLAGVVGAVALGTAALVVGLTTGPGFFEGTAAATYVYAAGIALVVWSFAYTYTRRLLVVFTFLAGAVAQFAWSLVAWVGGGDPTKLMWGTFYWHNQFAAYLLPAAVLGVALATQGGSPLRWAGAVTAIAATAGIVFSTSRATMALTVTGWLAAYALGILGAQHRVVAAARGALLVAVTSATVWFLPGPPLFAHHVSPFRSTVARTASGGTIGANGEARVRFWGEAIQGFLHHPWVGVGYGGFSHAAKVAAPHATDYSSLVHNGYLEALVDGGLLLFVPLMLLLGGAAWSACANAASLIRRRHRDMWWSASVLAALAVAAMHSFVDFDWTYPALAAQFAVLVGLSLAMRTGSVQPSRQQPSTAGPRRAFATTALVLVIAAGVPAAWNGGLHLTAPTVSEGHSR